MNKVIQKQKDLVQITWKNVEAITLPHLWLRNNYPSDE